MLHANAQAAMRTAKAKTMPAQTVIDKRVSDGASEVPVAEVVEVPPVRVAFGAVPFVPLLAAFLLTK